MALVRGTADGEQGEGETAGLVWGVLAAGVKIRQFYSEILKY